MFVCAYCSAFPEKPWPITTRELLAHLGGIRYYRMPEKPYSQSESDPEIGNTHYFQDGIAAGLKFFADDPLVAVPGTHFNYSSQGYVLIGCVIEGASGERYLNYVRQHILLPAKMLQTRPDDRNAIIPLRSRFYTANDSGITLNAELVDSSYKIPAGGWLSSATDLAKFEAALLNDVLLKRTTRDIMWSLQSPLDQRGGLSYGLGWQAGTLGTLKSWGHRGSQQGASAMILMAPASRTGVVVLVNSDAVNSYELAAKLFRSVLGVPVGEPPSVRVDSHVFERYAGTYVSGSFKIKLFRKGAQVAALLNEEEFPLYAASPREYFFKDFDVQITLEPARDGRAEGLIWHEGGTDMRASRIA